jgi:glycosyltransferase involved in cell wall biosynthesis
MNKNHLILFLLPRFSGGGAERVTLNLLTELYNRGYSVAIIVFDSSGPLLSMVPKAVPVYNLDKITLRKSIISLIKKVKQLNPNIIFSTFGYINVALLAIRWLLPQKIKIWIREANLPSISLPNSPHSKLMTALYKLLYKRSDKLFCSSKRMREEFMLEFLIPGHIIEILPNPVDTEMIKSSISTIERFDNEGVCYVASGRLTYQKGFDQLLRWFSALNNKTATLVILGDGDDRSKLIQQSNDLNIQDQVKFIGFCKNPWKWYAGADVFLLSSRWEGLPNVVLESLTCGTPIIATSESGGIAEIASQVKVGDLIVTSTPSIFINEMLKVKPNPSKKMKVSLLPKIYNIKHSVSILERLMRY